MSQIKKRGFASLGKEQRVAIASSGGRRAHELRVAHRFTHEEAVLAGKKGRKKSYGTTSFHLE